MYLEIDIPDIRPILLDHLTYKGVQYSLIVHANDINSAQKVSVHNTCYQISETEILCEKRMSS